MNTAIEEPFNVSLPSELIARLEQLTKITGGNKNAIAVAALNQYLETQAWQIQDIQEGLAEADRGEFASDEEVNAFFAKYDC